MLNRLSIIKLYYLKVMKKIILSAAVLAFAGLTTVKANTTSKNPASITIHIQQDTTQKTPVKMEDLPDPVKTTLKADLFKEWIPSAAFLIKKEGKEYYEIDVQKGEEKRMANIGPDGKMI